MKKTIAVLGAGLAGCTAALMIKEAGMEPVLIERRNYLGFELTGRYQIFTEKSMWDVYQQEGILNIQGEEVNGEICFYQGEVKTGMMKQIYEAGITCLLFSHVIGFSCDDQKKITGIALANNYGAYDLPVDAVLDCTGDGVLHHMVSDCGSCDSPQKASYVMELESPFWREDKLCLEGDSNWNGVVELHHSRRGADTRIAVFETKVPVSGNIHPAGIRSRIENYVKAQAVQVISKIRETVSEKDVNLINIAAEAAAAPVFGADFQNFHGLYENIKPLAFPFTPNDLIDMQNWMRSVVMELRDAKMVRTSTRPNPEDIFYVNGSAFRLNQAFRFADKEILEIENIHLYPGFLNPEAAKELNTGIAVAGLGAGGMAALDGIGEQDRMIGIESQYILGGTRTAGHVSSYYYGRQGGFTKRVNEEYDEFERKVLRTPEQHIKKYVYVNLALMHHDQAVKKNQTLLLGSVVFDAIVEEKTVREVLFANESGVFRLCFDVCMDMTGNGDVAALAGAEFKFGADEDGICQTYSQWGVEERCHVTFYYRETVGDYDMVDTTEYKDMLRASMIAQMKNSRYYSSNPLSFREGRRIIGRDYLDIKMAIRNDAVAKPLAVAVSTIDNHGKTTVDFSRMGFCAVERDYKVSLPFGCFIPKDLDAILVGGKAISVDKDTLSIVRMNADVMNAGYALGYVARLMAERGGKAVEYSEIKDFLKREDLIPDEYVKQKFPDSKDSVDALDIKDAFSLLNVLLQKKEEVLPVLHKVWLDCGHKAQKLLLAKALAWFGDNTGKDLILERMRWLNEHEDTTVKSDIADQSDSVRHGIDEELNDYWELNQLIEVSGRIRDAEFTQLLCGMIETCETGGAPYVSSLPYYRVRRDETCIPYFERIFNLVHVFLDSPDKEAAKALEGLLKKAYIGGGFHAHTITEEPFTMTSYLEITVAAAAYRCGSEEGKKILALYADDVRSVYAKLARRELNRS